MVLLSIGFPGHFHQNSTQIHTHTLVFKGFSEPCHSHGSFYIPNVEFHLRARKCIFLSFKFILTSFDKAMQNHHSISRTINTPGVNSCSVFHFCFCFQTFNLTRCSFKLTFGVLPLFYLVESPVILIGFTLLFFFQISIPIMCFSCLKSSFKTTRKLAISLSWFWHCLYNWMFTLFLIISLHLL